MQSKKVAYTIRKSKRAKRMRLTVYCDGSVVVTVPHNFEESSAEKFIQEKTKWLFSKINFFKQFQGQPVARHDYKDYLKHKDEALGVAKEKVSYFNKFYGYKFNKINIRNQKARWGSCSKKGNLNFNYRMLFLPEKLRDYIIVHEICHLKQSNHSRNFWDLVAKTFPQWAEIKKELKNKINLCKNYI